MKEHSARGSATSRLPAAKPAIEARPRGRPRKTEAEVASSARRKELIVTAARQFRHKGFDATTTRDIASASGMQSGSPFYHFKSKNTLLFAIMQEGMLAAELGQMAALGALPPGTSARDTLRALVRHHLDVLLLPGSDFIPVMLHEMRSLMPAQRKKIELLKQRYEESWRLALTELQVAGRLGADASLTRLMLFGAVHGTLMWYQGRGPVSLDQLADRFVDTFVRPEKTRRAA